MIDVRVRIDPEPHEGWLPGVPTEPVEGTVVEEVSRGPRAGGWAVVELDRPLELQESGHATVSGLRLVAYARIAVTPRLEGDVLAGATDVHVHLCVVPDGVDAAEHLRSRTAPDVWARCTVIPSGAVDAGGRSAPEGKNGVLALFALSMTGAFLVAFVYVLTDWLSLPPKARTPGGPPILAPMVLPILSMVAASCGLVAFLLALVLLRRVDLKRSCLVVFGCALAGVVVVTPFDRKLGFFAPMVLTPAAMSFCRWKYSAPRRVPASHLPGAGSAPGRAEP